MVCRGIMVGVLAIFLWSCGSGDNPDQGAPLRVAVAANVQFAMEEMASRYAMETGDSVEIIISSSGKLTTQIQQGAPFDLFISADTAYPEALVAAGRVHGEPRVYAYGKLVLWTTRAALADSLDMAVLQDSRVKKIAIANPRTAPYGAQSVRVLTQLGLLDALAEKLVYGESIAQTNQYIQSGACEVGFTALSVVMAPALRGKGWWVALDDSWYAPIAQSAVITRYGYEKHPAASAQFFAWIYSESGREILARYGYKLPGSDE